MHPYNTNRMTVISDPDQSALENSLEFEPSAFRDWTVAYCQLAYRMWVPEFKRQYGWSISDTCYAWDGQYTTMYRAPSEHLEKLFDFVVAEVRKDPNFFKRVAEGAVAEILEEQRYFADLQAADFSVLEPEKLGHMFREFCAYVLPPMPKFFLVMYFPQALELHSERLAEFEHDNALLIETRGKIDFIAAPIGNYLTEKFGQAILSRHGLDVSLARFLTLSETESLCETHVPAEQLADLRGNLEKRRQSCLVAGGEVVDEGIGEYLARHGWRLQGTHEDDELNGQVAFAGSEQILRGTARLILNRQMFDKLQPGDILVAPMTTPEYGPIFPLVKAIITDEGGVTCHAAVVARELKIPTIVGTKQASRVLKDGMEVEIDLEDGTIRTVS